MEQGKKETARYIMDCMTPDYLARLAKLIRHFIISSTTAAGSGHPTSSLSAVELMTALLFGGSFRFDIDNPGHPNNDRLIFSKGHASPLLYSLWTVAGGVTESELMTLRKFGSRLEGHPTAAFPYAEAATGSLGQGLSIGVGMAINARYLDHLPYRTYVLLGDGEMAEGSQWEAIQLAAHYRLDNLVGIIDVNRLGQRGETLYGHDLNAYEKRVSAFGWKTIVIDGHSLPEILNAYEEAKRNTEMPSMIIARTLKGKGISFLEDTKDGHGKPLSKKDAARAFEELGMIDRSVRGEIAEPEDLNPEERMPAPALPVSYLDGEEVSTRKAYGNALARIFPAFPRLVVLDAEVGNSTYAGIFEKQYPERFFEMYIAEQNMVGTALGLSLRGKMPFVSTFAAFFSRAFDQIRMSPYSNPDLKFAGSHAGVSIGPDGPSQMGLEDIAMFRSIPGSVVLYPSDAVSAEKLVEEAAIHRGIFYIRTSRSETPVIYDSHEEFPIGGSKLLRQSDDDRVTVIAAGITVHEALAAYDELKNGNILVRIIDLYTIKPIDRNIIWDAAGKTRAIITVEDHYAEGGIGEAIMSCVSALGTPVHSLAVRKMPKSGQPEELLEYEEISRKAIVRKVKEILSGPHC